MADSEEWTLGEVVRSLNRFEDALGRFEKKMDDAFGNMVPREVYNKQIETLEKEITRLDNEIEKSKSNSRSAWRIAIGSFIAPIAVGIYLTQMFGGG